MATPFGVGKAPKKAAEHRTQNRKKLGRLFSFYLLIQLIPKILEGTPIANEANTWRIKKTGELSAISIPMMPAFITMACAGVKRNALVKRSVSNESAILHLKEMNKPIHTRVNQSKEVLALSEFPSLIKLHDAEMRARGESSWVMDRPVVLPNTTLKR